MIKTLHIQNFRSLRNVRLEELQPVNLFIGANNSGKSNVLKAIEFASYLACLARAEVCRMLQMLSQKYRNADIEDKDTDYKEFLEYFSEFFFDPSLPLIAEFSFVPNDSFNFNIPCDENIISLKPIFQQNIIGGNAKIFNHLIFPIYSVDINQIRKPALIFGDDVSVDNTASNLILCLSNIRNEFVDIYEQIERDVRNCVPEFKSFLFKSVKPRNSQDKNLYLKIGYLDIYEKKYWSDSISDGILYFIALICIINQPKPPKILMLEEIEKGIHPRRIKETLDYIFSLAENKEIQIFMTSHSRDVVDNFKDYPESVFIFDKENGETKIKNLQTYINETNEKRKKSGRNLLHLDGSLGDHWSSGVIGGIPNE